ncbi:MAG: hypothetical protein P4L57_13850 [Rhizomicrobium sp.]|nr:hypothetical protein [Rhizomicrobium sp.]
MKAGLVLAFLVVSGGIALADDPAPVFSADGYANIKIGMTPDQLERAVRQKLTFNPFANHGCSLFTTPQMELVGLSFVVDRKILVRINVDYFSASSKPRSIKTAAGVGLGSSEEELLSAYGSAAVVKPNPGDPSWHTVTIESPDHSNGLIFETDGKKVTSMRAGSYPAITLINGCP